MPVKDRGRPLREVNTTQLVVARTLIQHTYLHPVLILISNAYMKRVLGLKAEILIFSFEID